MEDKLWHTLILLVPRNVTTELLKKRLLFRFPVMVRSFGSVNSMSELVTYTMYMGAKYLERFLSRRTILISERMYVKMRALSTIERNAQCDTRITYLGI